MSLRKRKEVQEMPRDVDYGAAFKANLDPVWMGEGMWVMAYRNSDLPSLTSSQPSFLSWSLPPASCFVSYCQCLCSCYSLLVVKVMVWPATRFSCFFILSYQYS